jgi:hypothetical protein
MALCRDPRGVQVRRGLRTKRMQGHQYPRQHTPLPCHTALLITRQGCRIGSTASAGCRARSVLRATHQPCLQSQDPSPQHLSSEQCPVSGSPSHPLTAGRYPPWSAALLCCMGLCTGGGSIVCLLIG